MRKFLIVGLILMLSLFFKNFYVYSREESPSANTPTPTRGGGGGGENRIQGDADGDGKVDLKDYFYYVQARYQGRVPTNVNVDFNGDGRVDDNDRLIIIRTLKP